MQAAMRCPCCGRPVELEVDVFERSWVEDGRIKNEYKVEVVKAVPVEDSETDAHRTA